MEKKLFQHSEDGAEAMACYFKERIAGQKGKFAIDSRMISTIFLAGAPWAGKSEFISTIDNGHYVILDSDCYRCGFEGYTGNNASDFQKLASRVMDKLYSYCMKNNLMVIVDGTFANEKITETNIGQCKKHQRDFGIILIYQDPVISYAFTKARELDMERNVPKEVFVRKYYQSFANVFAVLKRHPDVPFLVAYKRKSGKFSAMRSIRTKSRFDSRFWIEYNEVRLLKKLEWVDDIVRQLKANVSPGLIRRLISLIIPQAPLWKE